MKNKSFLQSLFFHIFLLLGLSWIAYLQPKVQKDEELSFTVVEKFKVVEEEKLPPIPIQKPPEPPKKALQKKKVYGISRKSMKSKSGTPQAKVGNTLAKTPDTKILKDDDEDSLPIPAEEYLISSMPAVIEEVRPVYPKDAKQKGLQGKVVFDILIDQKGVVRQAKLVQTLNPKLDRAAKIAMMKFRFRPASQSGKPVAVKIRYAINFVLEN